METGFTVWVTGPDETACSEVADRIAERLKQRGMPVEVLDARTPGIGALAGTDLARAVAFVAGVLARHDVAVVAAPPCPARAVREGIRADLGRMIEVLVPAPGAPGDYEAPERPEVEAGEPAATALRVARTLEVLGLLASDDTAYSAEEERAVIKRLKAFGYL